MLLPASDCSCRWVFHLPEPSDSGPTTPLPDKKLLVFILDRLQKWVALALPFTPLAALEQSYLSVGFLFPCRKDTYGVFSEPVDDEEVCSWTRLFLLLLLFPGSWLICVWLCIYCQLPDYRDIVKHPMDFSTLRKKLDKGAYANLEQFEVSVESVCWCSLLSVLFLVILGFHI
jgi:bromodomain-containing protein 7/9